MANDNPLTSLGRLSRNDQIFLGAGLLTFIFSFIAFAHVTYQGHSGLTTGAWHGVGVLAGLLVLASLLAGLVVAFSPQVFQQLPVTGRFIATALAVLALLFFIIRWLTLPSYFGIGYSLDWGGYVTLVLNVIMIAFGYLGMRAVGEAMPWEGRGGAAPPADPTAPGTPPTV